MLNRFLLYVYFITFCQFWVFRSSLPVSIFLPLVLFVTCRGLLLQCRYLSCLYFQHGDFIPCSLILVVVPCSFFCQSLYLFHLDFHLSQYIILPSTFSKDLPEGKKCLMDHIVAILRPVSRVSSRNLDR